MMLLDHCWNITSICERARVYVCVRVTENKSLDSSYRSAGCRSIVPGGKVFEHHHRLVEIITDYLAHTHVGTDTHSLSDKKSPSVLYFVTAIGGFTLHIGLCLPGANCYFRQNFLKYLT